MKRFIAILLISLTTLSLAQNALELPQQWRITEGENTWVVEIAEDIEDNLYRAELISGQVTADHELYIRVDKAEEGLSFTFMFNNTMVTDSGFGFACGDTTETNQGELVRYVGTIGGPQWSDKKESCTTELVTS
jgi:hypothetical protein